MVTLYVCTAMQRITAVAMVTMVTAYFLSEQLLLLHGSTCIMCIMSQRMSAIP